MHHRPTGPARCWLCPYRRECSEPCFFPRRWRLIRANSPFSIVKSTRSRALMQTSPILYIFHISEFDIAHNIPFTNLTNYITNKCGRICSNNFTTRSGCSTAAGCFSSAAERCDGRREHLRALLLSARSGALPLRCFSIAAEKSVTDAVTSPRCCSLPVRVFCRCGAFRPRQKSVTDAVTSPRAAALCPFRVFCWCFSSAAEESVTDAVTSPRV